MSHNRIIEEILEVLREENGEIRLLGRVNDDVIGNPSSREVFFFIPDLHVISAHRQGRFGRYGFNHAESRLLMRILERMAQLREEWDLSGENKLVTVQLGDFFDVWREFPRVFDPGAIEHDEQGELRDLLYRGVHWGRPCLKATMLLGNHDTRSGQALPEIPFVFKAFNRSQRQRPFLFASHGDAFDVLEQVIPEDVKAAVVNFIGDLTPISTYTVAQWGKGAAKNNKRLSDMNDAIVSPLHQLEAAAGVPAVEADSALPDEPLATVIGSPEQADHALYRKFYEAIGDTAQAHENAEDLRVAVIGHTHHSRMILCRPPDDSRPMLLMDIGSWIERCRYVRDDGQEVEEPNAQLGVLHENDARIYQISLPG